MSDQDNNISSKKLMDRIKLSDESAFRILFDRLWESMYLLSFSLLQRKDTAKDIVQEVWISFWERKDRIQNDNIEAYLINATRFRTYKELRDNKIKKVHIDYVESVKNHDSEEIMEKLYLEDTKFILQKAIDRLPKRCRQVFVLSRYEGLGNKEISKKLGISQRTVETHISNAIRKIKSEVPLLLFFVSVFLTIGGILF